MKRKDIVISILTVLAVACFTGCGESIKQQDVDEKILQKIDPNTAAAKINTPAPAGGLVLNIESTAITADEIISPVKPQLAELAANNDYEAFGKTAKDLLGSVLIQKITDIKLYQKAKAALPDNVDQTVIDKIVEQEVQRFIARHGGNYAATEQMLKKMGTNWQEFYKQQRRAILVQSFISDEVKVEKPMTHSELLAYYNSIKKESYAKEAFIEFRLIDLNTDKFIDVNDPNINPEWQAVALANKLIEQIKNGADFAELAKRYSDDITAKNGGLEKPVRPGSLVEPYNAIETAAEIMAVGQVSEPIIAGGHIFIVKLENKQVGSCEPFEKVQTEVEDRFVLARRQKMVDDMIKKTIAQIDLSCADDFLDFCVNRAYEQAMEKN
ncbi:MAG: peptidylprolyl isomerase [Phycisphaerae bacterium]|nr:peptidylprolyl isomerase [Phycisphaerae bacterium]